MPLKLKSNIHVHDLVLFHEHLLKTVIEMCMKPLVTHLEPFLHCVLGVLLMGGTVLHWGELVGLSNADLEKMLFMPERTRH